MTEEAGAITGELELLTRPTPNSLAIEAYVQYEGAADLYTVAGSPVRAISELPDTGEYRQAHERILQSLTTPRPVEGGNEKPVDLSDI